MSATSIALRLTKAIARLGESYTSGGATRKALFVFLRRGSASTYVEDARVGSLARPMLLIYAAASDPTLEGDTLVWRSRMLRVERAVDVRLAEVDVARLFIAA